MTIRIQTITFAITVTVLTSVLAAASKSTIRISSVPTSPSIEATVLGYYWVPPGFAAVEGSSGAAHARPRVDLAAQADRVLFPPGHAFAWIESSGKVLTLMLDQPSSDPVAIRGAWTGADLTSFSANGSNVVLYSRAAGKLQIISGLFTNQAPREVDVSASGVNARAVAIDDSSNVLITFDGAVYLVAGDEQRLIATLNEPSAVAFIPHSNDALICDSRESQVYLLSSVTRVARLQLLADASGGIDRPSSIAVSSDGQTALVLSQAGDDLLRLRLASGEITRLHSPSRITGLEPTRDASTFFLMQVGGPPRLLNANVSEATITFVPEIGNARIENENK